MRVENLKVSSLFYPWLSLQYKRPLYLLCSFGGQKNEKPRHTGRISRLLLCSKVAFGYIFQSLPPLPFKPIVCFSGAAELTRLVALYAPNQRSNSPSTLSEKHTVFHCAAYGAGWVLMLPLLAIFIEWSIAWLVRIKLLDKRRQWFLEEREDCLSVS